jgi:hypothetical protein
MGAGPAPPARGGIPVVVDGEPACRLVEPGPADDVVDVDANGTPAIPEPAAVVGAAVDPEVAA